MKTANPNPITDFLSSSEGTFENPVYRRDYVWKLEDCEKVFDDVLESILNNFRGATQQRFNKVFEEDLLKYSASATNSLFLSTIQRYRRSWLKSV